MPITVKSYIQHEKLALTPTLTKLEDIELRVLPQVNTDPSSNLFPYLIDYDDFQELESVLREDTTVSDYELVSKDDQRGIYYINYAPHTVLISEVVTAVNGFMTEAKTKDQGWLIQLQLPNRDALNTIWEYATGNNMEVNIIGIYDNDGSDPEGAYGLTQEQREALIIAYSSGYFCEPREKKLSEIAEKLDLSSTAMSGRLRRGIRNLIAAALTDE